jgi:hypothetical protein
VLARVDRAVRLVARIGLSVSIRVHRKSICFVIIAEAGRVKLEIQPPALQLTI